ncbi:MAG: hypothetical protein P8Q97_00235 [Myxococcota bacterium]|nr:hypothetical protein [Myxococcota bacterium]
MSALQYEHDALMSEHTYEAPQIEAGRRLHGGFDPDGQYISPRMKVRGPALEAWIHALRERGGDLMDTDSSLLAGIRYPSAAQSKLLLKEGLGQSFWNTLTITGHIEARGRVLAEMEFPDFQAVVNEDIGTMALGHLHKGLLESHGLDEGGEPGRGIGGHDEMWFALRDLAFGEVDYPEPVVPENIARPDAEDPPASIQEPYAGIVRFLLNLLLIEFRAERAFALAETLLRDPDLFSDRRAEAEHAAVLVDRIRQDETVHIESLRLYLGEIRQVELKSADGGSLPGSQVVDEYWGSLVHWATVEQPRLVAEQQRKLMTERISEHPEAARVQQAFDALEETVAPGA